MRGDMRTTYLALIVLIVGSAGATFAQTSDTARRAQALDDEVLRIAGDRVLWPGFNPTTIPLAIFDGHRTHLFRHPAPPEGFLPVGGDGTGGYVYAGRHPSVTANTYADVGGTMSATMMLEGPIERVDLARLTAVALHEAFHVFQRQRHPGWQANEADLFVYPIEDADLLALRRLETEALGRASTAADEAESACWAREVLALRRQRFENLGEPFVSYERGTELNEGLAAYVQHRAEGSDAIGIPEVGFPAIDVRQRAYSTGLAFALLLDRFQPNWAVAFEASESGSLDEALGDAIEVRGAADCAFEPDELGEMARAAGRDIEALLESRGERRKQFEELTGWRVIVEAAGGQPLWPQGFDPLNVERLDEGVLHTRFLKLGNDSGELQVIDTAGADLEALTEGAGAHPLFEGIKRVVIAGLNKLHVETVAGALTVRTDGFSADFSGVEVRRGEKELVLRLLPAD